MSTDFRDPFRCDSRVQEGTNPPLTGKVALTEKGIVLPPDDRLLPYARIEGIVAADYRVELALAGGGSFVLSQLGYLYEDFVRELRRHWEPFRLRQHLAPASDRLLLDDVAGTLRPAGGPPAERSGALRLGETLLSWIPAQGPLTLVPLAAITAIETREWKLHLLLDDGGRLEFHHLGDRLDPLRREIALGRDGLRQANRTLLVRLLDGLPEETIEEASILLADGRAVFLSDLAARLPQVWDTLQRRLRETRGADELAAALAQGHPEAAMIGLKRGLLGSLTGTDLFLLVPYWGETIADPGNAVGFSSLALSPSADETGGGRAELFFQLAEPADYQAALLRHEPEALARRNVPPLARALRSIHFRREPVFQTLAALKIGDLPCPEAAERLPELAFLRQAFLGRTVHRQGGDPHRGHEFRLVATGNPPGKE